MAISHTEMAIEKGVKKKKLITSFISIYTSSQKLAVGKTAI